MDKIDRRIQWTNPILTNVMSRGSHLKGKQISHRSLRGLHLCQLTKFLLCILIVPGWCNPHIEGMNCAQRDFMTGSLNIWLHKEGLTWQRETTLAKCGLNSWNCDRFYWLRSPDRHSVKHKIHVYWSVKYFYFYSSWCIHLQFNLSCTRLNSHTLKHIIFNVLTYYEVLMWISSWATAAHIVFK